MLVSLCVKNWACFRDKQEFSMATVGRVADHFAFDTNVAKYPRLNRAAAIYGPNGSGKSRFVEALSFVKHFVIESAKEHQAGEPIGVKPFRFDSDTVDSPAEFEVTFIENSTVYEYGFCVDQEQVHDEWLRVRPPDGRLQHWFRRKLDRSGRESIWNFGASFRGSRETWRHATRPNALYVSTAVQLNSETLRPIVDWFQRLTVVGPDGFSHYHTSERLMSDPDFRPRIVEFLDRADIDVSDIRVREQESILLGGSSPGHGRYKGPHRFHPIRKSLVPEFGYKVSGNSELIYLDLKEQSDGTRRIYEFSVPWLDVIDQDWVMVVDELDRSLHPHLVNFLIGLINCGIGTQRAQLVATVHEAAPLQNYLDRNQVWFTEKRFDQSAWITALSEYRPRNNESLQRGYLGGRYNAIPNILEPEWVD